MSSVTVPPSLQLLEQRIRQALLQHFPDAVAWSVRCARKVNALAILVHPDSTRPPDPEQVFTILEQAAKEVWASPIANIDLPLPKMLHLYLRYQGNSRPYAMKVQSWKQVQTAGQPTAPQSPVSESSSATASVTESVPALPSRQSLVEKRDHMSPVPGEESIRKPENNSTATVPENALAPHLNRDPYSQMDINSALMLPTGFPGKWSRGGRSGHRKLAEFWRSLLQLHPAIPLGALAGLAVGGVGLYALTRPCVVGNCQPLEMAQQLRQESLLILHTDRTGDAVLNAYEQLAEASYLLDTIPPWSGYHHQAQNLLQSFESEAGDLERVVDALEIAYEAAEKSQNPPHPIAYWQEIQTRWKEAIALLEQTHESSPAYNLAQRKLVEYKVNLNLINQRIHTEQQAQAEVKTARETARLAQSRESMARTVQDWQLAYATWQSVVSLLENIPRTTMAYAEAQQLLAIYQEQLYAVGTRRTQEELAADAYAQAIALADLAREAEQSNQWSQAVIHWQDALNTLGQIPPQTSYQAQAQPLVSSYQTTLANAQTNLRVAVAIQNAPISLEALCTADVPACSYTLNGEIVTLKLTSPYDRTVEQLMVYAPLDSTVSRDVLSRSSTLLQIIAAIGESAQVPIHLLDAEGIIFGSYEPNLAGFVQQIPESRAQSQQGNPEEPTSQPPISVN
jgi:tetratricopeptide (TPR) repeat protein